MQTKACPDCDRELTPEDDMSLFNVSVCARCEADMFRAMEAERVKEEAF